MLMCSFACLKDILNIIFFKMYSDINLNQLIYFWELITTIQILKLQVKLY
jgi:hypothetical protein